MKYLIIGMFIFQVVVEFGLSKLNDSYLNKPLPDNVKDLYTKERYEKFLNYKKDHRKVTRIEQTLSLLLSLAFLAFNLHSKIYLSLPFNEYINNFILIMIASVVFLPINIGIEYVRTFKVEQKYGFNKMNLKTFIIDQIKDLGLSIVLMFVMMMLLIYFYSHFGNIGMVILFVIALVFVLTINLFSLQVLKIFNKFSPLEEGSLKDRIVDLCESHGLKVKSIVVMDASTRTSRANAFCTGISKEKDISLDDNLIKLMSEDEIVAVFSHEIGHATYGHVYKQLCISFFQFIIYFIVIAILLNYQGLYTAFGFESINYAFMIEVLPIIVFPFSFFYGYISNGFSRKCEKEADLFAHELGYGEALSSALIKLNKVDLVNLNPHPFIIKLEYSHPTLSQRIEVLRNGG